MYLFYFIQFRLGVRVRLIQIKPNLRFYSVFDLVRINPKTRMDYIFEIDHIKRIKEEKISQNILRKQRPKHNGDQMIPNFKFKP